MLRLKLKELYAKHGITQKEVFEATGIRQGTLSGLANGHRVSWDVAIIERLLHYFEIKDIAEFIEYEPLDNDNIKPFIKEEYSPTISDNIK